MKSMFSFIVCLQLFAQLLAAPSAEQDAARPPCADQDLVITVDNKLELYIDGNQVTNLPNADSWEHADTVKVPASAKVIAVKGEDVGLVAGILASGANFQTDGSWKCSATYSAGWEAKSFKDSHWEDATVIGKNGVFPWGTNAGISSEASWIWTSKHVYWPGSDKVVYCRFKLPACKLCTGTGAKCIKSCKGRADGDYQSCKGCNVYASCSNGLLTDDRPCAPANPPLVWDDALRRCEETSQSCSVCGSSSSTSDSCDGGTTGLECITSCHRLADGDYQSCKGCNVYASCSNGLLTDERPCAPANPPLVWDDSLKRCEYASSSSSASCRCD